MIAQTQASWRNDKVNLRECKENMTNESHPAGGQEDCPRPLGLILHVPKEWLLVTVTIALSQRWKMLFTKRESKHYLEQISYHTLMLTKETGREGRKEQISQGRKLQWEQVIWIKPEHVWTKRLPEDRGNSKEKIGFYTAETLLDGF